MKRVSAPVAPPSRNYRLHRGRLPFLLQLHLITASNCISKLAWSQPPSVSINSHDYGLQVCMITASRCISKLARSRPPSASPISLDHSIQVYLKTRTLTASKFAQSRPPSASPNPLGPVLQVHLSVHSVSVSKCISKNAWLRPPSTSSSRDGGCMEIEGLWMLTQWWGVYILQTPE